MGESIGSVSHNTASAPDALLRSLSVSSSNSSFIFSLIRLRGILNIEQGIKNDEVSACADGVAERPLK